MEEPSGAASGHWSGFLWVSVGLLANAALITHIGFIASCAMCFVLAVRGRWTVFLERPMSLFLLLGDAQRFGAARLMKLGKR